MKARPARLARTVQERKKVLAYLAALPADARKSLQRLRRDIKAYRTSPGTLRFAPGKAMPVALVRRLVKTRVAELRKRD